MSIWHTLVYGLVVIIYFQINAAERCRCLEPCADDYCNCTNHTGSYNIPCVTCDFRVSVKEDEGVIQSHDWHPFINRGYRNVTVCSVAIESPVGTTIRLYIEQFKTECSWDYLHFHDGISPFNQTIGIYGGVLVDEDDALLKQDREIVSSSNRIYLDFRPDQYVNHDGFSIHYKVNGCPSYCNDHGRCESGKCICDSGWQGASCRSQICNCLNDGHCEDEECVCTAGYVGEQCEFDVLGNYWSYLKSSENSPGKRASFGGALVGDTYWTFGGYQMQGAPNNQKMAKFNLATETWSTVTDNGPIDRNGHTLTAYQDVLFMFGGQANQVISGDLWKYETTSESWKQVDLNDNQQSDTPISSMGHCAVLINSTIYFIGGLDREGVSIIDVQTYQIELKLWTVIGHRTMTRAFYDKDSHTRGYKDSRIYHGRFGATCVYNPLTDRIAVFGGLNTTRMVEEHPDYWMQSEAETIRESTFVEYDPYLKHWSNLYMADKNTIPLTYLASGSVVGRNLVVFGGRHLTIDRDRCFNRAPYILNLETGEGRELTSFRNLSDVGPVRMGHSSFSYNNSVYFFGGYNGKLHDDFIVYHLGKCSDHTVKSRCNGDIREDFTECKWNEDLNSCYTEPLSICGRLKCSEGRCTKGDGFDKRCVACGDHPQCTWDQHFPDTCRRSVLVNTTGFDPNYRCRNVPNRDHDRVKCSEYKLCEHCTGQCVWTTTEGRPRCSVNINHSRLPTDCKNGYTRNRRCSTFDTCSKCIYHTPVDSSCIWCELDILHSDGSRQGQCVDSSTYYARFPYGQCVKWFMGANLLSCSVDKCEDYGNCSLCQSKPECGWCDDGSGTGTGTCRSGTYLNPLQSQPDCLAGSIPASWYYDTCPLCQCNGHSNCTDNIHCDKCTGNTQGAHCDTCIDGFYGDATNRGTCRPCQCSEHSEPLCNDLSGRCTCDTIGIGGVNCDECLVGFEGNPKVPGGTCYKELEFKTLSVSVKTRKINFFLMLNKNVTDDIIINISSLNTSRRFLLMLQMVYIGSNHDSTSQEVGLQSSWQNTFKRSKYGWTDHPAELRIRLNFGDMDRMDPSLMIEVKRASSQIDLKQFFIIFFSCIVVLLLTFVLAWTAKIRYSQYRNQRHQELQLLERALRPFQTHKILFKDNVTPVSGTLFEVRPLGIEPLAEEKYGIVSYLITMPGPEGINLAIVSGSFASNLSYAKVISNPNLNLTFDQ